MPLSPKGEFNVNNNDNNDYENARMYS